MINVLNFMQLVFILHAVLVYFQFHFFQFTNLLQPLILTKIALGIRRSWWNPFIALLLHIFVTVQKK